MSRPDPPRSAWDAARERLAAARRRVCATASWQRPSSDAYDDGYDAGVGDLEAASTHPAVTAPPVDEVGFLLGYIDAHAHVAPPYRERTPDARRYGLGASRTRPRTPARFHGVAPTAVCRCDAVDIPHWHCWCAGAAPSGVPASAQLTAWEACRVCGMGHEVALPRTPTGAATEGGPVTMSDATRSCADQGSLVLAAAEPVRRDVRVEALEREVRQLRLELARARAAHALGQHHRLSR